MKQPQLTAESIPGVAEDSSSRPQMLYRRHFSPALLALALLGLVYLAALVSMPPEGLTQHDTGAKYLQVRNLRLTPSGLDWSINYPARSLDPDLDFVPFRARQHSISDGRIYLQWPIFLGLLTRIPWKLMGFWGLYLVPLLAGLGVAWASYLLALRAGVPRSLAWLAVPLTGLATPISIYSLLFFEHTLASLLVTGSLIAGVTALTGGTPSRKALLVCGVLLAFAVYFRSELYVLALVMGLVFLFLAWREPAWRRACAVWLGAFVVALVPLWLFYAISDGSILPLHAIWYFTGSEGASTGGLGLPAVRYIGTAGLGVVPDFLFGPQTFPSSAHIPAVLEGLGLLGVLTCALPGLTRLAGLLGVRLRRGAWEQGALGLGMAFVLLPAGYAVLSGAPYHNLHGFLLASPFVALGLWPVGTRLPQQATASRLLTPTGWLQWVTLLHVGLHALIISVLSGLGPISRHEWGQRYLLPAYPALVVLALLAVSRIWEARPKHGERTGAGRMALLPLALGVALAAIGVLFSLRGYTVTLEERKQVVSWQALTQTLTTREPLVTDIWWLPLNLAPVFYTRPIMLAEGDTRLGEWVRQMKTRGVTRFALMSDNTDVFSGQWQFATLGVVRDGATQQAQGMWLQNYLIADRRGN